MLTQPTTSGVKRQQITRVPPYRKGDVVVLLDSAAIPGQFVADRTKRPHTVKTITARCANPRDAEDFVEWLVHFEDDFFVEWHLIQRLATPEEISANLKGAITYGTPVSPKILPGLPPPPPKVPSSGKKIPTMAVEAVLRRIL